MKLKLDENLGRLARSLLDGLSLVEAARLGCAAAGISVTRPGTAQAMPARVEVDALLRANQVSLD